MAKNIFWDLDGTLTDSSEGITKCAKMTLDFFGKTGYECQDLTDFIGPPLRDTFVKYGIPAEDAGKAVDKFRSRYLVVGKFENKPYEGIADLLKKLKNEGCHHFVATSKPEGTAVEILDKFELSQYFDEIAGARMDASRDKKEEVITYLLGKIGEIKDVVMVGDTSYDVVGAKALGIDTIGVDWGFGSNEEMLSAGAIGIAYTMDELYKMIKEI